MQHLHAWLDGSEQTDETSVAGTAVDRLAEKVHVAEVAAYSSMRWVRIQRRLTCWPLRSPRTGTARSVHAMALARVVTTSVWYAATSAAAVAGCMSSKSPSWLAGVQ